MHRGRTRHTATTNYRHDDDPNWPNYAVCVANSNDPNLIRVQSVMADRVFDCLSHLFLNETGNNTAEATRRIGLDYLFSYKQLK